MTALAVATTYVRMDEKSMLLAEVNRASPLPGKGWRRVQIIQVERDDKLAQFEQDLGPASSFTADQFQIPGGVPSMDAQGHWRFEPIHTVAELRFMADTLRGETSLTANKEPEDLWGKYRDMVDMGMTYRKRNARTAHASR